MNSLINQINHKLHLHNNLKFVISILQNYNDNDWKNYIKYHNKSYHKELVYRGEFDIFIITWNPNKSSNIHNHPCQGCVYKILSGNFLEKIYEKKHLTCINTKKLSKNDINYIDDNIGYHQITNLNKEISVSLHIYKPVSFICNSF